MNYFFVRAINNILLVGGVTIFELVMDTFLNVINPETTTFELA